MVTFAFADPASDIASQQSQAQSVQAEIDSMNSQLEAKVESYNYANVQLGNIKTSITDNQNRLSQAQATLGVTQERLDKRISEIYRNGSSGILDVLMDTKSLNDFLSNYDMLAKLGEQDRNDVEQIKMLKSQIETAQKRLTDEESSQQSLVSQLATDKDSIQAGITDRQQKLDSIHMNIAQLQQQEASQQAAEQAAQQQQLEASAAVSSNSGGTGGGGSGGGGGGSSSPPPAHAGGVVAIAMQYLGVPYVWGGASPAGFDCSGLVMYVYAQVGIYLPHSAAAQYEAGTPISYSQLAPGDLVFYGDGGIEHVAIYIGGGQIIQAPYPGTVVQISPISGGGTYRGACRL